MESRPSESQRSHELATVVSHKAVDCSDRSGEIGFSRIYSYQDRKAKIFG